MGWIGADKQSFGQDSAPASPYHATSPAQHVFTERRDILLIVASAASCETPSEDHQLRDHGRRGLIVHLLDGIADVAGQAGDSGGAASQPDTLVVEIGRWSGRERVCQYV